MWIKNQKGTRYFNMGIIADFGVEIHSGVAIITAETNAGRNFTLGSYSTEERCMEILGDIETELQNECYTTEVYDCKSGKEIPHIGMKTAVYLMPKK